MFKIYINSPTGELVTDDGKTENGYPGLTECFRSRQPDKGTMTIRSMHDNSLLGNDRTLEDLNFADCQKENGDPYASLTELWDDLTPWFTT